MRGGLGSETACLEGVRVVSERSHKSRHGPRDVDSGEVMDSSQYANKVVVAPRSLRRDPAERVAGS